MKQYFFNEKSKELTPFTMAVSETSLHYVIKILLDLIKACDFVQRYQISFIVDEERSFDTAGEVKTLLKPSTVTNMGDETKLTRVVNVVPAKGDPASPVLYNKTASVLKRHVLHAIKILDDGSCRALLKAFADDSYQQLASDLAADKSLANCRELSSANDLSGSGQLPAQPVPGQVHEADGSWKTKSVCRTLSGNALRGSHAVQCLV